MSEYKGGAQIGYCWYAIYKELAKSNNLSMKGEKMESIQQLVEYTVEGEKNTVDKSLLEVVLVKWKASRPKRFF